MSGWETDDDGLLESGLDDEGDFVEGLLEDDEDDGHEANGQPAEPVVASAVHDTPPQRPGSTRAAIAKLLARSGGGGGGGGGARRGRGGGKYRLRAMSPQMEERFPDVQSMLITRDDGSQILFVRKGR